MKGSDPSRHFIEIGHPQRVTQVPAGFSSEPLARLQVTGTEKSPEIIETTLVIGSDTPRDFGIQERRPEGNQKALSREFYAHKRENGYGTPPAIWVDWIELEGPITEAAATESRIVHVEPEETVNPANEKEVAQIEDGYARFSRWQKAVDKAAATPENQAKIAEIRETDRFIDHPVRFYTFADRLEGTPHPKSSGSSATRKRRPAGIPRVTGKTWPITSTSPATGTQSPLQAILARNLPRSGSRQDFRRAAGTGQRVKTAQQAETETLDEFRYGNAESQRLRSIPQRTDIQRLPRTTRPHRRPRSRLRPRLHRMSDRTRVGASIRIHG